MIPGSKAYEPRFNISIGASVVSCATAGYVFTLLYVEELGHVRLASLVPLYLTVCLPLDASKAWGYFTQDANLFGRHATMIACLKLFLLLTR